LNPRPGGGSAEDTRTSQQIIPDFILSVVDNNLELTLNSRNDPDLRISRSFQEMLSTYAKDKKKDSKEAVTFIKSKIDAAKWFIDAIRQRQHTLLSTMTAIMNFQKDYFLQGDERELKPMILKDIADMVGLDIPSTVSRVANSKYVETPYGTFLLKYFFSEGLQTDSGEEASSREIEKILEDNISKEDNILCPTKRLAEILNKAGTTSPPHRGQVP
jgi:RNA polymerase sigma-54 factor